MINKKIDENHENGNIEQNHSKNIKNSEKLKFINAGEGEGEYDEIKEKEIEKEKEKDGENRKEISKIGNDRKKLLYGWLCPCCIKGKSLGGISLLNRKVKVWWSGIRNNDIKEDISGFAKGIIISYDKISGKKFY